MKTDSTAGEKFQKLVEIMGQLRAPGGCPWDREQTFDSIKPYTLEETYEVLDAIDRREWKELAEELGDFLLQAVFYAQMGSEQGLFRIEDALDAINEKLIRRHPHVFGEESAESAGDVKRRPSSLGAARAAGAGGGATDRLARRGRGVRLGESRTGAREAA
jgi:MazG family protein